MSCSAILLSDVICSYLQPRPDALGDPVGLDWGTLACNFVSCLLAWTAYAVTSFSPEGMQHNLLALKFVSSFCGSISCFSASISYVMVRTTPYLMTPALLMNPVIVVSAHVAKRTSRHCDLEPWPAHLGWAVVRTISKQT